MERRITVPTCCCERRTLSSEPQTVQINTLGDKPLADRAYWTGWVKPISHSQQIISWSPVVCGDHRPPVWLKVYECWTKTLTMPCAFYFVVLCTCVDHFSWLKCLIHNIFWGDLGNMLLFSFYVYWTISLRNEEVGLHKVLVNFPPHGHTWQRSCGRSCCNFVVLLNAMMNNYWTMTTKYWSARHCLIEKFFDNLVQYLFLSFDHLGLYI